LQKLNGDGLPLGKMSMLIPLAKRCMLSDVIFWTNSLMEGPSNDFGSWKPLPVSPILHTSRCYTYMNPLGGSEQLNCEEYTSQKVRGVLRRYYISSLFFCHRAAHLLLSIGCCLLHVDWNELHHLLIMESLGGNAEWSDRFLGYHAAIAYYWFLILVYLGSPRIAYQFMELLEVSFVLDSSA
jgi:hypothetical protein